MTRADLETEAGRAAYRKELRLVAWPVRWGGLALIVIAAAWTLLARSTAGDSLIVAYGMLALGWAMVIAAVFLRTRHHRARMAEIDGGRK